MSVRDVMCPPNVRHENQSMMMMMMHHKDSTICRRSQSLSFSLSTHDMLSCGHCRCWNRSYQSSSTCSSVHRPPFTVRVQESGFVVTN